MDLLVLTVRVIAGLAVVIFLVKTLVWPVVRKAPFEHRMSAAVGEHEDLAKIYDGLRQPELAKIERDLAVQLRLLSGWVPELPAPDPEQLPQPLLREGRQMTPREVHDTYYGFLRAREEYEKDLRRKYGIYASRMTGLTCASCGGYGRVYMVTSKGSPPVEGARLNSCPACAEQRR